MEEEEEEGGNVTGEMEVYHLDIIDDTDDTDNDEKGIVTSELTQTVSATDTEKKEKKKDQKFFWDKESNEKASKTVNEEDDYKWEDEVRFTLCYVRTHCNVQE
jgi:hypothetical protein